MSDTKEVSRRPRSGASAQARPHAPVPSKRHPCDQASVPNFDTFSRTGWSASCRCKLMDKRTSHKSRHTRTRIMPGRSQMKRVSIMDFPQRFATMPRGLTRAFSLTVRGLRGLFPRIGPENAVKRAKILIFFSRFRANSIKVLWVF